MGGMATEARSTGPDSWINRLSAERDGQSSGKERHCFGEASGSIKVASGSIGELHPWMATEARSTGSDFVREMRICCMLTSCVPGALHADSCA